MNYISAIISIVVGLFILSLSYSFLSDYFVGNSQKLENLQLLQANSETTVGIFDSSYLETKIGGTKMYSIKYTFKVDEKEYEGDYSFPHPDSLTVPIVAVKYLKEDPSIFSTDVETEIEKAKKDSQSNFSLIGGIIAGLIGLAMGWSGISRFKQPKTVDYT